MNETDRKKQEQEQEELIRQYVGQITGCPNSELRYALLYFLTKERSDCNGENFSIAIEENNLIAKRKLFILKVLKECTYAGRFQIATFPSAVAQKLISAFKDEKAKEEDKKQAHIAKLVEEMNEIF